MGTPSINRGGVIKTCQAAKMQLYRTLFFHYENIALALKGNQPTLFGIFLKADAKPPESLTNQTFQSKFKRCG